jgi:hypothetical protein
LVKNGRLVSFALVVAILTASTPMFAHHGQVQYEHKDITLQGTVTKFEWNNPHAILWLSVKGDKNNIDEWHLEILPLESMRKAGWTSDSLKPGDVVTVTGKPGKGGEHIMWLDYLTTSDGRRMGREKN